MKLFFSKLSAVAVLAISAISICAQPLYSAAYGYANLNLAGIGTTAGATTQAVTNQVMDVRGFQNVTLQTVIAFSGSTTSNVVYTLAKSVDKVNFETTGSTWTLAGNGATPVIATTTIATGGAGWLKLVSIQNTHATLVLTNTSFSYGIKRQAP